MKARLIIPIFALLLCATACKEEQPYISQNCTIVYSVDGEEQTTVVKNSSEWEQLLDQFCNYAEEGKSVTFHNLNAKPSDLNAKGKTSQSNNNSNTITTKDRNEIKAWMRRMEQSGKTVNVTYDRQTGVWNGQAYAVSPHMQDTVIGDGYSGVLVSVPLQGLLPFENSSLPVYGLRINADTTLVIMRDNYLLSSDSWFDGHTLGDSVTLYGQILIFNAQSDDAIFILNITSITTATVTGTWQYSNSIQYSRVDDYTYMVDLEYYYPQENGIAIYYTFNNDGSATRTEINGPTQTDNGTWNFSNDQFFCNLADLNGGGWDIIWLTDNTMIISRMRTNDKNQPIIEQITLERNQSK